MRRMDADLGFTDAELTSIGGAPFSMTVAGLRMARAANAVAQLHGETARTMWKGVTGAAPITAITNGVHVPTWQDARVRAALAPTKDERHQSQELWAAHLNMKAELCELIAARTGAALKHDALLIGFARRAAMYKRADLVTPASRRCSATAGRSWSTPARPTRATAAARRWCRGCSRRRGGGPARSCSSRTTTWSWARR
jgi:starch phosphorylase